MSWLLSDSSCSAVDESSLFDILSLVSHLAVTTFYNIYQPRCATLSAYIDAVSSRTTLGACAVLTGLHHLQVLRENAGGPQTFDSIDAATRCMRASSYWSLAESMETEVVANSMQDTVVDVGSGGKGVC